MADSAANIASSFPEAAFGDALHFDQLRFSLPIDIVNGPEEIAIEGFHLFLTSDGFQTVVTTLSQQISMLSRERIDGLLSAMDENPRLRPVRWYYASLFRGLGLRDDLDISGLLIDGGIEIRARFAQAESGNILRQLRDRARNLATVTVRLHLSLLDGAIQARFKLSPDVNGLLTNLILDGMGARPGLTRVDASTVRIDLGEVVASATAEQRPRPRLVGRLMEMRITPEQAVAVLG